MYSNRFQHSQGHSRQHSDKSSRQWDGYDDRWEERREPHRETQRNSHHKYGRDAHSSTERRSRSREYSDSPVGLYSRDSLNRDWSRKSPVRRRTSSPNWGGSGKKRQRFAESDKDDYRYRRVPKDKSPDSYSHARVSKDFKNTVPKEDDFKYRKTTQDSRHRYRHEEFTHRQQHDDFTCRRSSGYYRDGGGRERSLERSPERTRSRECFTKSYAKPRERNSSPSADHRENRAEFTLSASSRQSFESSVTHQSAAVPEQKTPTKGFQRFLNVLNKGVNVATLLKVVNQTSSSAADDEQCSATSLVDITDHSWSSSCAGRQQESRQITSHWSESERSKRLVSPPPRQRSFSPKARSLSDEKSQQRADGEGSYFSSNSRSRSPSAVEKKALTPEDEHKHKHMQDVLQAIGMNLGFEELGQMSHRIQERLYGKKDRDEGYRRESRERDRRRVFSPRPQSRSSSSSSRSSFSPFTQEYYAKRESYGVEQDLKEIHEAHVRQVGKYGQNSSTNVLPENEKYVTSSQENTAVFSHPSKYTLSEPSPTPVMPAYSPVNCPPLPYPTLPPSLPHVGPRLLLPHLPPFLPYPPVTPFNIFPAVLAQARHILPQHINNPQPLLNPAQPLNTTLKSKTLSRPRCLQVIETKQPG